MTIGRISDIDKWVYQNSAEPVEVIDGSLIDNVVYSCRRGVAFVYEECLNCWSSGYLMKFISYSDAQRLPDQIRALWDEWQQLADAVGHLERV